MKPLSKLHAETIEKAKTERAKVKAAALFNDLPQGVAASVGEFAHLGGPLAVGVRQT